jgi:hypothetical protein
MMMLFKPAGVQKAYLGSLEGIFNDFGRVRWVLLIIIRA